MTTSTISINKSLKTAATKLVAVLFWVLLWQALSVYLDSSLLLPSPIETIKRLFELCKNPDFFIVCASSVIRITAGCVLGIVLGTVLGAITAFSKLIYELILPLVTVIRSTPVASFIILALVWIKRDNVAVFISCLMVLPILWSNVCEGIKSCDKKLLEMSKIFNFSFSKRLKLIYLPSVSPYFFAGCTSAIGLSWKAGVAAEVLSLPKYALGSELYYSKIYLEMPSLFAVTLVVIIFSIIIEKLLSIFFKRLSGVNK